MSVNLGWCLPLRFWQDDIGEVLGGWHHRDLLEIVVGHLDHTNYTLLINAINRRPPSSTCVYYRWVIGRVRVVSWDGQAQLRFWNQFWSALKISRLLPGNQILLALLASGLIGHSLSLLKSCNYFSEILPLTCIIKTLDVSHFWSIWYVRQLFLFSVAPIFTFLSWQFQFSTANNRIRYYPSVPWNYDCVRLLRTWDPLSKAK